MLSLPDFQEKQLLFVQAEWGKPSSLRIYNDNIVFEKEKKVINRVSLQRVFAVFICGDLSLTTSFLRKTKAHGVSVFLLKHNFEMYADLSAAAEGHYLLREKQYSLSPEHQLSMARPLIVNKVENQMALLKLKKNIKKNRDLCQKIEGWKREATTADSLESLLGLEGTISRYYFSEQFRDMKWRRRAPRTREDMTNLLMDMGYTFLFHLVDAILRLHGFDTYKGFYHQLFFQRKSLACDLVEPFRCIIDKQIVKSHNLGQIKETDFIFKNGSFEFAPAKRAEYATIFMQCLMDRKEEIFTYIQGFYRHVMDPSKHAFPYYQFG